MRTWTEVRQVGDLLCGHHDRSRRDEELSAVGHRIAGIAGQVQQNLGELPGIRKNRLDVGTEVQAQTNVLG